MKIRITKNIPDFFIVGAAKSGTTSIWYYLGQHPDIFMTKDVYSKELGFFYPHYEIGSLEKHIFLSEKY